ncbi:MAG: hypothetical protein IJ875_06520 [Solobacterium sp.]|nr:hypothetical protein [Solobacterium sp.]
MNNKVKFCIAESFVLLSFSYAADGYPIPSLLCACIAVGMAICSNSLMLYRKKFIWILAYSILQMMVVRFSSLEAQVPVLPFLIICNTSFSYLWMEKDFADIKDMMQGIVTVMLALYFLAFVFGDARFSFLETLLYIALIFAPIVSLYLYKCAKAILTIKSFVNTTMMR